MNTLLHSEKESHGGAKPQHEKKLNHEEALGFTLHHLSPIIGTEVHGIDIGADLQDETITFLSDLLVQRKVLFFREQNISMDAHIAFARRFGELEIHPFTANNESRPEVIHLANGPDNKPSIDIWHSDVTWREEPSLGSILRGREIPEVGGDTLFANMEAAYDGLSAELKEQIDGLYAIHDNSVFLNAMRSKGLSDAEINAKSKEFPPVRHPVVRTHPVSGKKSIYVNTTFTQTIEGMDLVEADLLLAKLYQTAAIPNYQCRFRWAKDSFAFWDNRGAQHYAAADYWPAVRCMERVTIKGDRPA